MLVQATFTLNKPLNTCIKQALPKCYIIPKYKKFLYDIITFYMTTTNSKHIRGLG